MIALHRGGLTELIPSLREKREGLLRGHTPDLLAYLAARLQRTKAELGLSADEAGAFRAAMARIRREEPKTRRIHRERLATGVSVG